jgi:hypothetical protein
MHRALRTALLTPLLLLILGQVCSATPEVTLLDDFEGLAGWTASASEGSRVEIAHDTGHTGLGMRIDFELGGGGFLIVRKPLSVRLPTNYAFTFWLRGAAQPNNLELKLVDRSQRNVWWSRERHYVFPVEWRQISIKKRRCGFAGGPGGGGVPKQIGFVELAITAGSGGKGSVWIDDLQLVERKVATDSAGPSIASASTFVPGHEPQHAADQDPQTAWRSGTLAAEQWVQLDFGHTREYGGLVIDWDLEDFATFYEVQISDDGERWTSAYRCGAGNGRRSYIYMPDAESRYVRLDLRQSSRGQGYAIRTIAVKPYEFSSSPNHFFESIAADAPVGTYPKYFYRRQTYWTVVGVDGDHKEALINEEGMIEAEKGGFSIEPFLYADGKLITWNDVRTTQELAFGYLPIPSVVWQGERLDLRVTAFAAGKPGESTLYVSYRVENHTDAPADAVLFLTVRPFQVIPPWQNLNVQGGVSALRDLVFDARTVWVNQEKPLVSLTPPDHFGAAAFEEGPVTDFLVQGKLPPSVRVTDPLGWASGALEYNLRLSGRGHQEVYVAVPFHGQEAAAMLDDPDGAALHTSKQLDETIRYWQAILGRVRFELPPPTMQLARALKSTLAYILINRAGPAIHAGPRTYARSWIRDGAFTSEALLEMGFTEEPRAFLRWFSQYQTADGRIPCCVDWRGADPTPEHDSNGEFVFAVAEYYRFTRDIGFLHDMWPAVVRAIDYLAALRQQRMTDEYRRPDKQLFYGLLPESISHEGYASNPVHSYWDDFFALRGIKDAATLASIVGDDERGGSFAVLRDAFRADLYASIRGVMAERRIDYIPASADLGDFDPSSTAIAVTLASEQANLPQAEIARTFDKYYQQVQERRRRIGGREGYTPYEFRNVGALVRLGQRERAVDILGSLLADQRPPGWNQWQEIVWSDRTAPEFIGDMPHTWVGSCLIQSVRTMFAYEREADRALVLAAGLPSVWVANDPGVAVKRLPTHYGVVTYSLRQDGPNALRLKLSGDLTLPPGGIVVEPPLPQPLKAVRVNGAPIETHDAKSAKIHAFPADVVLEY